MITTLAIGFILCAKDVALAASIADSSPKIQTVEDVAGRLANELGSPIVVSPDLSNLQVFLEGHGAPPTTKLAALARCLHASLRPNLHGLVLSRTSEDLSAFTLSRTSERTTWVQKRIDRAEAYRSLSLAGRSLPEAVSRSADLEFKDDLEVARGQRILPDSTTTSDLLPSTQLLISLVTAVGLKNIAAVPSGHTEVWEDTPVTSAHPLPEHEQALEAYATAMTSIRGSAIPKAVLSHPDLLGMRNYFLDWNPASPLPTRLRLAAVAEDARISIRLSGYDRSGMQRVYASISVLSAPVFRAQPLIVHGPMSRNDADWVRLSPDAARATALSPTDMVEDPPSWFTNPESTEPLNAFVAEGLAALGGQEPRKCFAMQVCDSLWGDMLPSCANGQFNLDAFKAMLAEWSSLYECLESENAVVWRPKEHLEQVSDRADRHALGKFARDALRTKHIDLRALSLYHEGVGAHQTSLGLFWERSLTSAPSIRSVSNGAAHEFFRLIGSVSDEAWAELCSGAPGKASELGVTERLSELFQSDRTEIQGDRSFPDVLKHAPELFPAGDLESVTLYVRHSTNPRLGLQAADGDHQVVWGMPVPLYGLMTNPTMSRSDYEKEVAKDLSFQLGSQEETIVTLMLPYELFQRASFVEPISIESKVLTYDELDQNVKDFIWNEALAQVSERNRAQSRHATHG